MSRSGGLPTPRHSQCKVVQLGPRHQSFFVWCKDTVGDIRHTWVAWTIALDLIDRHLLRHPFPRGHIDPKRVLQCRFTDIERGSLGAQQILGQVLRRTVDL